MGSIMDNDRDIWQKELRRLFPNPFAKCAAGSCDCGHNPVQPARPPAPITEAKIDTPNLGIVEQAFREMERAQGKTPSDQCQSCGHMRSVHSFSVGCTSSDCMGRECGCPVFFERRPKKVEQQRVDEYERCDSCDHPYYQHENGPCRQGIWKKLGRADQHSYCGCTSFFKKASTSPIYCAHANEMPGTCSCPVYCYCKSNSCTNAKQEP